MNTQLPLPKDDSRSRQALIALSDYQPPTIPAEHAVRRLWKLARQHFKNLRQTGQEPDPAQSKKKLAPATKKALDEVAGPPACGPLLDEFDDALADWLADPTGLSHYLVVLPPCDRNHVMAAWAQSRGHAMLNAPPRHRLHETQAIRFPKDEGEDDALLVIPRLEDWFLRHRNGLASVRALFAELAESRRRCLIGCNSWAWAFLVKSAGAALVLPQPMSFAPFDALRLQQWFSELAAQEAGGQVVFRLAGSGVDVLQKKDDGQLGNNYLEQLASRSHGIPWVAWQQWRQSLRTSIDTEEPPIPATENDSRTLWITDAEETLLQLPLPLDDQESGLLVLHALLMHGSLSAAELAAVLPVPAGTGVISALLRADFIQKHGNLLAPQAGAYPAIRSVLKAAGFPLGKV